MNFITRTPEFKQLSQLYAGQLAIGVIPNGWEDARCPKYTCAKDYDGYIDFNNNAFVTQASTSWYLSSSPFMYLVYNLVTIPLPLSWHPYLWEKFSILNKAIKRLFTDDPWRAQTRSIQTVHGLKTAAEAMAWVDTVRELDYPYGYKEEYRENYK